jgi:UPF0716 family protein affecting phage T7 exclusion
MQKEELMKAVKFWGTALIIGAAALIMMPGLLTYVMGLSRIVLLIVITLVIATIVGNVIFQLRRVQSKQTRPSRELDDTVEGAATANSPDNTAQD